MGCEGNTGEEKVSPVAGTQEWGQGLRYLISWDLLGNRRCTRTNSSGGSVCPHSIYLGSWVPGKHVLHGLRSSCFLPYKESIHLVERVYQNVTAYSGSSVHE